MRDRVFKTVLIILLIVFFVWIYWMSGIPCAYLVDFPTAVALLTVSYTGLLWLAIELYFMHRASREVDVYSEVNPSTVKEPFSQWIPLKWDGRF